MDLVTKSPPWSPAQARLKPPGNGRAGPAKAVPTLTDRVLLPGAKRRATAKSDDKRRRKSADLPAETEAHGRVLTKWLPEDKAFWRREGKAIARRNLWLSIPSLFLSFAVWQVWSVVAVNLNSLGFKFSPNQLFWLAAAPALSGATLRGFYAFMVPLFGGRKWTAISTASLLIPTLGIGIAIQDATTSYATFLILALFCGFGGGNFSSSMANISYFFPKSEKGSALGLNGGLGNLGVSAMQLLAPLVIAWGAFAGSEQTIVDKAGQHIQIAAQNAGFFWVPLIVASAVAAWFGMNDVASARTSFREQAVIYGRKHSWIMGWLYLGTFGSFIGYAAGFPLLIKQSFPAVNPVHYAWMGPLIGALARTFGGWLSDKLGGATVTFWNFVVMTGGVLGVLYFLPSATSSGSFAGFFAMFMILFCTSGIGSGSTFRMIPVIFLTERKRAEIARGKTRRARRQIRLLREQYGSALVKALAKRMIITQAAKDGNKEAAAVLGFAGALGAYGGFLIPKSYGTSISATGGPEAALWGFFIFYLTCIAITWWFYAREDAEVPC